MPALEAMEANIGHVINLRRARRYRTSSGGAILGGMVVGGASMPAHAQVDPFVGSGGSPRILNIPEYAPLNLVQARRLSGADDPVASARVQVWTRPSACRSRLSARSPEFQTVQGTRQRMLADYRIRRRT